MAEERERRTAVHEQAADLVRARILTGVHTGRLRVGDRLSSYREVAAETGLGIRAAARIYRDLADEGLVEVRGRAGVFVAPQLRVGGDVLEETARWMVDVIRQAWRRRIPVPGLPAFLLRCTAGVTIRCACVESSEDHLLSLCAQLHEDFGFETTPVHADRLAPGGDDALPQELRGADILVTSTIHASRLGRLARLLGKPLAVTRVDPEAAHELERHVAAGELVVLAIDPRFVERIRLLVGPERRARVHGMVVRGAEPPALDPGAAVLVSTAVARKLRDGALPSATLEWPALSPESADLLAEMLVRANLKSGEDSEDSNG